ncbi:hypothetical protein [Leifsonia sp. LS-T14]|uniref:hypothetical protein n=1 Tax=unclassified Leifsonia TaxID=2663824 RepID=UPI0035A74194
MTDPNQPATSPVFPPPGPGVGQPQHGQPQYAQPQYAQPQYAQPQYAAAPYGPPASPNGWGAPVAAVPRSRALGLSALLIAAPVFVLSIVASIVIGISAGPLATRTSTSFNFNTGDLTPEQAATFAPVGVLMGVQMLLGTALGILALVLGIIAVATKRGRPLGVVAICLAAAAPIVSFAVYVGALLATLPPA